MFLRATLYDTSMIPLAIEPKRKPIFCRFHQFRIQLETLAMEKKEKHPVTSMRLFRFSEHRRVHRELAGPSPHL